MNIYIYIKYIYKCIVHTIYYEHRRRLVHIIFSPGALSSDPADRVALIRKMSCRENESWLIRGRNPAITGDHQLIWRISRFFTGLFTSQVVQDFFHQQYNVVSDMFFFLNLAAIAFFKNGQLVCCVFFSMDRCYSSCWVWHLCELCVVYFHGALRWEINP